MKTHNVLTMVLPTEFAIYLAELFGIQFELEQCKKERVGDNIYRYTVEVPAEKRSKIKNFILGAISGSKNLNLN